MAYNAKSLILLVPRVGRGEGTAESDSNVGDAAALWVYRSPDNTTVISGDADYFSDAKAKGLQQNDAIIVIDEDTGASVELMGAIASDGTGTIV